MEINILLLIATLLTQLVINCFTKKESNYIFTISNCTSSLVIAIICFYTTFLFINNDQSFIEIDFRILKTNIEPLTLIFLNMISILWLITNIYSHSYLHMNPEINIKKFYICTTGSILSTIMIAISNTLISTFAFYELLTLFTYPLIANTNTKHETKEARFYLYFLISTSSIILFPLILFIGTNFSTVTFKVGGILNNDYTYITPLVILVLYGVAKAAIVPVHFWLPRAMVAPIPVSALLHAVAVVKSGIFIIIKMYIYIFGIKILTYLPSWHGVNIITILCALSLLLSATIALYQVTLKKLLAYSTINQLSLCLLAASLFTVHGIKASILHLLSHAVSKITLFFTAGYIYSNARITKIEDLNGLAQKLPLTSFIFAIGALSIIGIPPLAGFISKAYIIYAALANTQPNYLVIVAITASIIFSSHYFGTIIYKIYFQKMDTKDKAIYSETANSSMIVGTILSITLVCAYVLFYPYIICLLERITY